MVTISPHHTIEAMPGITSSMQQLIWGLASISEAVANIAKKLAAPLAFAFMLIVGIMAIALIPFMLILGMVLYAWFSIKISRATALFAQKEIPINAKNFQEYKILHAVLQKEISQMPPRVSEQDLKALGFIGVSFARKTSKSLDLMLDFHARLTQELYPKHSPEVMEDARRRMQSFAEDWDDEDVSPYDKVYG